MNEFLKLILTGERLQRFRRVNLLYAISAVAEFVLAFTLLFTASPEVHAAVSAAFGLLLSASGIFNVCISFYRAGLYKTLLGEQMLSDETDGGEVSNARKSLAENYAKLFNGRGCAASVLGIIPVAVYFAASVLNLLVNLKTVTFSYIVPVLYVIATVLNIIIAFVPAIKDSKQRTLLYENCDGEIAVLKRNAGYADKLIARQSYNAKNTATRTQELFLCDRSDRAELRRLFSVMGYCALALIVIIVATVIALGLMSEHFDGTFMLVSSSCLIAAVLAVWVAAAVWIEIRRSAIYRRNAAKLTDSEADGMRKYLQSEFVKLQRTGNIFFSLFCGIPTVVGFILGAVGAINDPEVSFIENASAMAGVYFFISAFAAFIIWTVIYAVYRNKVKPVELRLSSMGENDGKTN